MDSPQQQPDEFVPQLVDLEDILPAAADVPAEPTADAEAEADTEIAPDERALRLPAHAGTVTAEDVKVRLVLAADLNGEVLVDASDVESIGQAVLQLLVAARAEARGANRTFRIENPSPAFVDRVTRCRLADAIGIETGE
jgi:anti-anti-sigma regulatory factor